ncbi:MAG: hypothetical protein QOK21_221 [Solirubrobacteraceae bacterium]|jgi:hypothetical protein|nr:hypothetical protein [Solirubrobacteraceae bacterium]
MGYRLLGFVVWKGAKWYLGRRVGPHPRRKAALAGGALALSAAALALALKRGSDG